MQLTQDQLNQFEEEGYLFLPNCFTGEEVSVLKAASEEVYAMDRQEVWRESSGVARTAFAAHTYNEAFARLGRHPRLVDPVMQLLDGPVYMHQYKVNAKAAFDGEVWQWHQDYGTWKRDDDMPEPRAMNIAVFLDDVTAANGPLLFLPKSHKLGVIDAGHDLETTSYPLWTLDRETVSRLAQEGGCVAPTGPAGSVLMFSSLLVHASPPNISPFGRTIVYLSLCHVDNHIRKFQRAEWIAHRDFTPIEPLGDDCLAELARQGSVAAE
jgi:ectoine hydroxylase